MMVANSFDLWKKDVFFSAAEELQDSADRMESAYRKWLRERTEVTPEFLDVLSRELQTTLGTAKWQLEEFERAVILSYGRHNDNSKQRHREFISAIGNQISHAEASLKEYYNDEPKQSLRWINLDKEECDDLALFLSGDPGSSQTMEDACDNIVVPDGHFMGEKHFYSKNSEPNSITTCNRDILHERMGLKDTGTSGNEGKYVIELEPKEVSGSGNAANCQSDRAATSKRTWSSPNFGAWKIVIADSDKLSKKSGMDIEATPKDKDVKPFFWKQRYGELPPKSKGGLPSYTQMRSICWMNQNFGRHGWFQSQPRSPRHLRFRFSAQVMLALMLSIFLIGKILIEIKLKYILINIFFLD